MIDNSASRIAAALHPPAPRTTPSDAGERPDEDRSLGQRNMNPRGLGLWALICEDLDTHEGDWLAQGFWALAVHRYGNWRMGIGNKVLRLPFSIVYKVLYKLIEWTCGISLAYTVRVGRRVHIWHHGGMILGALSIGDDVHLRQNTTLGVARRGDGRWMKPTIGDRADIGTGAVIVGGITIGHDSSVGANAVVLKDVPPGSIAVGVPATVRAKKIPNPTQTAELSQPQPADASGQEHLDA